VSAAETLGALYEHALEVYRADRDGGASVESVAFDAGRVDAFKEALETAGRVEL